MNLNLFSPSFDGTHGEVSMSILPSVRINSNILTYKLDRVLESCGDQMLLFLCYYIEVLASLGLSCGRYMKYKFSNFIAVANNTSGLGFRISMSLDHYHISYEIYMIKER